MNIQDFIRPELLILIPVCWGIGLMLKSTPVNNQWIPAVLCLCSVLLACLYVFSSANEAPPEGIFAGVTQGVLCWLVAWQSYDRIIKPGGNE